jgi:hypothetical protein
MSRILPTQQQWSEFGSGAGPAIIEVCTLSRGLVNALAADTSKVLCCQNHMKKVRFKHGVAPHNLWIINENLEFGMVLQCAPNKLTFISFHEPPGAYYEAVIKVTQKGHEIWIETFHRTRQSEVRRKQGLYQSVAR